jgi:hypothetical protein
MLIRVYLLSINPLHNLYLTVLMTDLFQCYPTQPDTHGTTQHICHTCFSVNDLVACYQKHPLFTCIFFVNNRIQLTCRGKKMLEKYFQKVLDV